MLDPFFVFDNIPTNIELGTYNPLGVVLSYFVAAFASYAALLLANDLVKAKTLLERRLLHCGGAFALGAGIWSMHFIGMLSFRMRLALEYDPWLTLISLLIAIGVAYGALSIAARDRLSVRQILVGGVLLGFGICAMHYTGMAAMNMDADLRYVPGQFLLSVAIAIAASCAALWIAFTLARRNTPDRLLYQFGAALIMGGAICGMHYTGMAAAVFIPLPDCRYDPNQNFDTLMAGTAGATLIILAITLGLTTYRKTVTAFQLRDSESKLRAAIDHAVDGLITINQAGIIESFNPASERQFGYTVDEVVGRNIKMLMPEPYHSEHDGYLARYLASGEARIIGTAGHEVTARRKDGSTFLIDLSVSSFELTNGRHFSGIIRDITARKETERRLQESAEREGLIIQHALDAIITIDDTGHITEWNEQAEKTFGWRREEALGQAMAEAIIPPADRAAHYAGVQRFLTEGVVGILDKRIELTAQTKQGQTFPVEMAVTSQKVGDHYYFTAFLRDITAQKHAEAERDTYLLALERSNGELEDFGHIVSHDLKEPIRGLRSNISFFIEDFKDKIGKDGEDELNNLIFICERMRTLVDDLLEFSRLGRSELAIQETDPNELVHEVEQLLGGFLNERGARIIIPHPMPTIICDKTRITEVFRNLITNSIKYNDKDDRCVEVGFLDYLETADGFEHKVFYVKDNGIGIESVYYDQIFQMFKRLHHRSKGDSSSGVGLTLVKKIIENHGGRIWLDSQLGIGTTFYFTLQEKQAATAEKEEKIEGGYRAA